VEKALPFGLLVLDSDNDSEFINWHVKASSPHLWWSRNDRHFGEYSSIISAKPIEQAVTQRSKRRLLR
jgi:hypothetical protein